MRKQIYFFLEAVLSVILFVTCLSACSSPGSKVMEKKEAPMLKQMAQDDCGVNMYYSLGGLPDDLDARLQQTGSRPIILINQRNIEGGTPNFLDKTVLLKFVDRKIPDPKSTAYVVLDWEGDVMKGLIKGRKANPAQFDKSAALYDQAYELVKSVRPNVKVGFYGYPVRNYHHRDEAWRSLNQELDEVFRRYDVLFPSLYDFYVGRKGSNRYKRDSAYVSDNTLEALKMGGRINKPVLPFVWHRYHTSNKKRGLDVINESEFYDHVFTILDIKYQGQGVNGMVWWGSELSQFAKKNRKIIPRKEINERWEEQARVEIPRYNAIIQRAKMAACKK